MDQNLLDHLPEELRETVSNFSDLLLERALMKAYQNLSEENKTKMAQVFDSGTKEEQLKFLNDYFSDLNRLILLEAQNLVEELKQKSAS